MRLDKSSNKAAIHQDLKIQHYERNARSETPTRSNGDADAR